MRFAVEDAGLKEAATTSHEAVTLPAPVGGWVSNESIARENPGTAEVMENFIPTSRGIRPKRGSRLAATVGLLSVQSLMVYRGVNAEELFAASDDGIYDVTSPLSAFVPITPAITGLTSVEFSYVNFATPGGQYLLAFNGTDPHLVYDGTAWASNTPAITGVSTSNISQVWVHGNRIWMIEENSMTAWYLPVDSIGGAAQPFSLAGVFQLGGKILFGTTWTQDSGSGSADRCVFVSNKGEVAVYNGDDPSAAASWVKFGVYEVAAPMGRFAFQKFGGDLAIVTVNGITPMSKVSTLDKAALTDASITRNIEPDWKAATARHSAKNWRFLKWDQANLGIVAVPTDTTTVTGSSIWGSTFVWGTTPWGDGWTIEAPVKTPECFVVNQQGGAWCKISGWDCRSMAVFNGGFYFGTSRGTVVRGDVGGSDQGGSYECKMAYWPSRFRHNGDKQFMQASAVFEHSTSFAAKITMATNNLLTWSASPPTPPNDNTDSSWDTAKWDESVWDPKGEKKVRYERWVSLNRRGRVGAILLQMSFSNTTSPEVEFTDITITYEKAALVT